MIDDNTRLFVISYTNITPTKVYVNDADEAARIVDYLDSFGIQAIVYKTTDF